MATAASQPYIAKLGFSDPDRSKDRHGLACEYLFERLLELDVAPRLQDMEQCRLRQRVKDAQAAYQDSNNRLETYSKQLLCSNVMLLKEQEKHSVDFDNYNAARSQLQSLSPSYGIMLAQELYRPADCINVPITCGYRNRMTAGFADVLIAHYCLGEVKITKQSAETVLQQINYYREHLAGSDAAKAIYILTDYDCSDLQRLTQGSDIHVYRLGKRFEDWIAARATPSTPEL